MVIEGRCLVHNLCLAKSCSTIYHRRLSFEPDFFSHDSHLFRSASKGQAAGAINANFPGRILSSWTGLFFLFLPGSL